jgi:hypothetical protein
VGGALSLPLLASSAAFALGAGGLCYGLTAKQLDNVNGGLVAGIVVAFVVRTWWMNFGRSARLMVVAVLAGFMVRDVWWL